MQLGHIAYAFTACDWKHVASNMLRTFFNLPDKPLTRRMEEEDILALQAQECLAAVRANQALIRAIESEILEAVIQVHQRIDHALSLIRAVSARCDSLQVQISALAGQAEYTDTQVVDLSSLD